MSPGCSVQGVAGTAFYMSPEMLKTGEADLKTDIWSFEVAAHMLRLPYNVGELTAKNVTGAIIKGGPQECKSPWLSRQAVLFLRALLERDARHRVSADRAMHTEHIRTCEDPEEKNPFDLRPVLKSAIKKGLFDGISTGSHLNHVDVVLEDIRKNRKYGNNPNNILNQCMVDDTILVQSVVGIDLLDQQIGKSKGQEDSMSNISTACDSSLNRDSKATPSLTSSCL